MYELVDWLNTGLEWLHQPVSIFVIFAFFAIAEALWPVREALLSPLHRWVPNFSLTLSLFVLAYFIAPLSRWLAAWWSNQVGFGLLPWLQISPELTVLCALFALDLSAYILHRISHNWAWLWRLHLVHHSDTDVDVSTSYRHHPLEVTLSTAWHVIIISLLGAPLAAVLLYEALHKVFDIFSHANLRLPHTVDNMLRWLVITPAMHRVHHSSQRFETNSNYGGLFSVWDRLFGSYRTVLTSNQLGLEYFRSRRDQTFTGLLLQPFRAWQ